MKKVREMLKIAFLVLILVEISMGCNRWDDYRVPTTPEPTTTTPITTTYFTTTTPISTTCKPNEIYHYGYCYLRCEEYHWDYEGGRFKRYTCEPPPTTTQTTVYYPTTTVYYVAPWWWW